MGLLSVTEALDRVLAGVMPLGREDIGLRYAARRTLALPVAAMLTSPPFDASAMDGYAVRTDDCAALPATLNVIGESAAGRPYRSRIERGEAVRIFTGAAVPLGADSIVIQEDVTATHSADAKRAPTISLREAPTVGKNIRCRGQDFTAGEDLLPAGRVLTPRDILLAATAGHATLPVYRKPSIAILATGDELVEPGVVPGEGQIIASNSYALAAMAEAAGATCKLIGIADDTLESLGIKLLDAEGADVLLVSGGASVGDHDLVRPALEAAGASIAVHKIAMRPGKPMFFGSRLNVGKTQRIIGLPGNPVSALVVARVFLIPLIAKLLGREHTLQSEPAILATGIEANGPRQHFMRAALVGGTGSSSGTGQITVAPLSSQDSSMTSILAKADCLIVVAANAPALPAGATVKILRLDF